MTIKIESIYTKDIEMPSLKAWVQRTTGLIRDEWGEAQVLKVR